MRGIKNKFTKDGILSIVSQEEIFAKYFQIDIETINECIHIGKLINSPIRLDVDASFGFKYNNNGKLRARDFSGYFWGDCFDAVAYVLSKLKGVNYNVRNKADFYYILKNIVYAFPEKFRGSTTVNEMNKRITNALKIVVSNKHIIEFIPRNYNTNDVAIWKKWNLTSTDLLSENVYAVEQFYIDRYCQPEAKYYYTSKDPCYAYVLGVDEKGIYNIELYFPNRQKGSGKPKFITNSTSIRNINNIKENSDVILIVESNKDRLAISKFLSFSLQGDLLNISIINYPASYKMTDTEYNYISGFLSENGIIISFFDFDAAGRKAAKYHKYKFDIPYIFIPNGQFGLDNYGSKDFCELLENYNQSIVVDMIKETIKKYK